MKRNIHGIFLLDKPLGLSSNHALQRVKRLFNAAKAGHTGSLDPLATGMLPICFGEATKYSQHLLDADKCYEVTAKLGVRTNTGDAEGFILDVGSDRRSPMIESTELRDMIKKFTGEIQQIPPMYSALKHKGRPLYEYARKGETIDRPARTVTISSIELIGVSQSAAEGSSTLSLRVHCSKGTYIRSLIDDIGEALGCGAHVIALRRLWVASFQASSMMTLEDLSENRVNCDAYLLPIDAALTAWPKQILDEQQSKRLLQGLPLFLLSAPSGFTCFYNESQVFLGVGNVAKNGEIINKRLTSVNKFCL